MPTCKMSYIDIGPLQRFLAWWWPSLLAWLPTQFQPRRTRATPWRFLRWDGHTLDPQVAGQHDPRPAVLLLPSREVLIRPLQLPATAAGKLRDIAYYEVERQTPFTVDQVYFAAVPQAASLQRSPDTLIASLVVVPKHNLDRAVTAVSGVAQRLVAVDVLGSDDLPVGVNLLPVTRRYHLSQRWRNWNLALSTSCCIAVIGFAIATLHAWQRGIDQLEDQARPLLAQAREIQQRQEALSDALALSSIPTPVASVTMLESLSSLSANLPQGSHLTRVEFEAGTFSLQGHTDDLSGMLAALKTSPLWTAPELTGSRTSADGKSQAFSMRLHLRKHPTRTTP